MKPNWSLSKGGKEKVVARKLENKNNLKVTTIKKKKEVMVAKTYGKEEVNKAKAKSAQRDNYHKSKIIPFKEIFVKKYFFDTEDMEYNFRILLVKGNFARAKKIKQCGACNDWPKVQHNGPWLFLKK